MVDVTWYEITITSVVIFIIGWALSATGYLEQGITLFVFMSMGLFGFLAVRAIRGRKFDWR